MNELKNKIRFYLNDSKTLTGKLIEVFLLLTNLAACAVYVAISYHGSDIPRGLIIAETGIACIFIIEYALRFWTKEHKLRFVFSLYSLVDILSIVPIFFNVHTTGFLRTIRIIRILRFVRFFETEEFFFGRISMLRLQVMRIAFTIVSIIFIWAGFIHYAESSRAGSSIVTFDDSLYYTIVTLSTVGFGDITPVTRLGRFFTLLLILSGMILIPWQAGRLVSLLVRRDSNRVRKACANCGLESHEPDALFCKSCGTRLNKSQAETTRQ